MSQKSSSMKCNPIASTEGELTEILRKANGQTGQG
jgi:hypothetical protein